MGFTQNNDVRGRILVDSDICKNYILESLRDVKMYLAYYKII